ncbi:apolipoprotein L6-like isoform X1 [Xiphophorus maculatus]|uniref:Apolipoprotein L3-like n=1 Tax=Xiphophorus maculatus TaxID=8083 RepID=M4A0R2_XIPMA|nr:apolipoprotein L6-like isoform X1 [Xiphophorus maculatus]
MEQPPVPLPRKIRLHTRSFDDDWLKCDSAPPQSQNGLEDSTPQPVPSRMNVRRQYSEQHENIREQVQSPVSLQRKISSRAVDEEWLRCDPPPSEDGSGDSTPPPVISRANVRGQCAEQDQTMNVRDLVKTFNDHYQQRPPLLIRPASEQATRKIIKQDDSSISCKPMTPLDDVLKNLKLKQLSIEQDINVKAGHLYKAIQSYIQLMSTHDGKLKVLISELRSIADNLDKVSKGTKIAGITGGASTAAGGVAAAAGVILAPFTAGASLALTVVGAGVAAAGGVTGASAAIANKANLNQDKKKIERTLQEFKEAYEEILTSLKFINEGMDLLKRDGVSALKDMVDNDKMVSKEAASAVQLTIGKESSVDSEKSNKVSVMLDGFALGMEIYFNKDGQTVKKKLASQLALNIRKLAKDLASGLEELQMINDEFRDV